MIRLMMYRIIIQNADKDNSIGFIFLDIWSLTWEKLDSKLAQLLSIVDNKYLHFTSYRKKGSALHKHLLISLLLGKAETTRETAAYVDVTKRRKKSE